MANELTLQVAINFVKALSAFNRSVSAQFDVTGTDFDVGTQYATTSDGEIALSGVTTPGFVYLRNLDSGTETIDVECTSVLTDPASYSITLEPGEFCLFRAKHQYIHVLGSAASVQFEYAIIED